MKYCPKDGEYYILPSVRFKEDNGITKNALVTPSLGIGITYTYKLLAVQIPFYYNSCRVSQRC